MESTVRSCQHNHASTAVDCVEGMRHHSSGGGRMTSKQGSNLNRRAVDPPEDCSTKLTICNVIRDLQLRLRLQPQFRRENDDTRARALVQKQWKPTDVSSNPYGPAGYWTGRDVGTGSLTRTS